MTSNREEPRVINAETSTIPYFLVLSATNFQFIVHQFIVYCVLTVQHTGYYSLLRSHRLPIHSSLCTNTFFNVPIHYYHCVPIYYHYVPLYYCCVQYTLHYVPAVQYTTIFCANRLSIVYQYSTPLIMYQYPIIMYQHTRGCKNL